MARLKGIKYHVVGYLPGEDCEPTGKTVELGCYTNEDVAYCKERDFCQLEKGNDAETFEERWKEGEVPTEQGPFGV